MSAARIGDLERRLANMQRPGKIEAVDYDKARVKVRCGKNVTAWIPWMTPRAGGVREWCPPEVGEQVLVFSPSGEMANAYCQPAVFQNSAPANGNKGTVRRTDYQDGASVQYDRETHTLTSDLTENGTAKTVTGPASVTQTKDSIKAALGSASAELKTDSVTLTVSGASLAVKADAITMTIGGCTITFNASGATVQGGDVKADAISLKTHTHPGVMSGAASTGAPVG